MGYSYYSPGSGTVALSDDKPAAVDISVVGEPRDMLVACSQAKRFYGIVGGECVWTYDVPGWPRAIEVFRGLAFVGVGAAIFVMDPRTGYLHRVMGIPNAPAPINGLSIVEDDGTVWVVCCFDGDGPGLVRAYHMVDLTLTEVFVNPLSTDSPRHATYVLGWLFVCDTFNHEVYGVTLGGAKRDSIAVYFPNHIQMLDPATGLITAEHENRILRWQYYPTVDVSIDVSAPVAPFNDPAKGKADIEAGEGATLDPNSPLDPKKSLCAVEASGPDTLYSPNSARLYGDDLLVADTDNHRVIVIRDGQIVTEVTGFNDPVTAVLI